MDWQTIESKVNIQYEKKLGGFRPNFQGKPESYYELSVCDVITSVSVCIFMMAGVFFLCVGFFFWSSNISTYNLVLVWSIILCIFILFFIILAYCCSKGKLEMQEKLVKEALDKQMKDKEARQKLREKDNEIEMRKNKKMDFEKSTEHLIRDGS